MTPSQIRPLWISDNSVFGLPRGTRYLVTSDRKATAQLPDGSFVTIDGDRAPVALPAEATSAAEGQFMNPMLDVKHVQNEGW